MQHSVAESTECTRKKVEGTPTPPKSRGTAERIAAENRLKILKERLGRLRDDTSEQWQRDEHPELLAEKREVVGQIKALEDSLL